MELSRKAKDAIKTGLALALVFYIGLRLSWSNVSWAATTIVALSLPTVGQSMTKGVLRISGTVIGAAAALLYLGLFPQDRFALIAIVSLHLGFMTYKMMGSKHAYFWQISAVVCLVVAVAGPGSSPALFERATFRLVETSMGIVVLTLIWVFLWPRSDRSTLGDIGRKLVATQQEHFESIRTRSLGESSSAATPDLQKQATQLSQQFEQSLHGAGSEAYDVREVRHLLRRFLETTTSITAVFARWEESLTEIRQIDVRKIFPGLDDATAELAARFGEIQRMFQGTKPEHVPEALSLATDETAVKALSPFDRAAAGVVRHAFERIDSLTRSLYNCVSELEGFSEPSPATDNLSQATAGFPLPLLDVDRLRSSLMVMATLWAGFFIWVLFDPPGHVGFTQMAPTLAIIFAKLRVVSPKLALMPVATLIPAGLLVYVFVLPHLSVYWELAIVIFLYTFLITYIFPSGAGKSVGLIGLIMTWGITNHQSYNFAASLNTLLFLFSAVFLVLATSYIIQAPRPEKALLGLMRRYFTSAEFLLSRVAPSGAGRTSLWQRYRAAYHRQEIATLPEKIAARGHVVDQKKFPNIGSAQVQSLVATLSVLSHRIGALDEASGSPKAERLVRELLDHVRESRAAMVQAFKAWSKDPGAAPSELSSQLQSRLQELESLISDAIDHPDGHELSETESESFYRILASYRGVSNAILAYAGFTASFDWAHWREERL